MTDRERAISNDYYDLITECLSQACVVGYVRMLFIHSSDIWIVPPPL